MQSIPNLTDVERATRLTAGAGKLATTRWSVVLAAAGENPHARAALEELCRLYWLPAFVFVRRHLSDREAAQDLTQQFFCDVLRRGDLRALDPSMGRFRQWLYTSLKHALANHWRYRTQQMRDERKLVRLDAIDEGWVAAIEARDDLNPEQLLAAACSLAVYARARELTRKVYSARGQEAEFDAAVPEFGDAKRDTLAVARSLGMGLNNMRQRLFRIRIAFRGVLYREIAQTVKSTAELEDEIRFLVAAMPSAY